MFKRMIFMAVFFLSAAWAFGQVLNFDADLDGKAPKEFSVGLTGKGKAGVWIVKKDPIFREKEKSEYGRRPIPTRSSTI